MSRCLAELLPVRRKSWRCRGPRRIPLCSRKTFEQDGASPNPIQNWLHLCGRTVRPRSHRFSPQKGAKPADVFDVVCFIQYDPCAADFNFQSFSYRRRDEIVVRTEDEVSAGLTHSREVVRTQASFLASSLQVFNILNLHAIAGAAVRDVDSCQLDLTGQSGSVRIRTVLTKKSQQLPILSSSPILPLRNALQAASTSFSFLTFGCVQKCRRAPYRHSCVYPAASRCRPTHQDRHLWTVARSLEFIHNLITLDEKWKELRWQCSPV